MKDMSGIIEKIKVKMALKNGAENILDKQVAHELEITSNRLAIHKNRGTVPYVKIMKWCKKNNISIEEIFFRDRK